MLVTLHQWRSLLVRGPEQWGELVYYGTRPLELGEPPCDVLVATHRDAELHLLCRADTGQIARVEYFAAADADPCELHFRAPQPGVAQGEVSVWIGGKKLGTWTSYQSENEPAVPEEVRP
jgi:hypothetical protein